MIFPYLWLGFGGRDERGVVVFPKWYRPTCGRYINILDAFAGQIRLSSFYFRFLPPTNIKNSARPVRTRDRERGREKAVSRICLWTPGGEKVGSSPEGSHEDPSTMVDF